MRSALFRACGIHQIDGEEALLAKRCFARARDNSHLEKSILISPRVLASQHDESTIHGGQYLSLRACEAASALDA